MRKNLLTITEEDAVITLQFVYTIILVLFVVVAMVEVGYYIGANVFGKICLNIIENSLSSLI